MRIIIPDGASSRTGPNFCEFDGCKETTREGKPYCSNHVELNLYASEVVAHLERRAQEDGRARRQVRGINTGGVTATELLQNIADHGPRTKERLCRELNIDRAALDGYVEALRVKGLVTVGLTKRGSETVDLTK